MGREGRGRSARRADESSEGRADEGEERTLSEPTVAGTPGDTSDWAGSDLANDRSAKREGPAAGRRGKGSGNGMEGGRKGEMVGVGGLNGRATVASSLARQGGRRADDGAQAPDYA